jgi:DNA-binding PadR family transcriptional regulator
MDAVSKTPESLLPLKHVWFHILLAIAGGARHGYAIRKEVELRTDGTVRLWPTTLYGAIAQLVDLELITETETPDADDERRRLYELTRLGRRTLAAEADRLEGLVRAVRNAEGRVSSRG